MNMKKFLHKRVLSVLLCLVMLLCLWPNPLVPRASAATGYDNGYTGGRAGWGKIYAHGIDVSEHQGTGFDFQNLKNNGYSYVILRCGFVSRKDYRFEEYYKNAKAAGLNVGVYFYSYATTTAEASREADLCLSYIQGKKFEYPVYFDFEDSSANSRNGTTAKNICLTFLDKIAKAGYLAGLYGYAGWLDEDYGGWVPTASICQRYECWLANYYDYTGYATFGTKYSTRYGMYQYQSDKKVGNYSPLDANICYKDYPSIVKQYGFNGYSAGSSSSSSGNGPVSGVYTIRSAVNQNYVLDISGGSKDSGANLQAWTGWYVKQQKFAIEDIGGGYYTIRALHSGHYVDVAYGHSENGTNIWQCSYIADSDAQKWKITKNSDGTYSFFVKCNGKALDLAGGVAADGTNIQLYDANGTAAQKWVLEATPVLTEGIYKLGAKANSNYVLNVAGNSKDNGANVWLWEAANNNSDRWVVQATSDGYYTLRETTSNKYLDVANGGKANGTNVQLYTGNGTDSQKWSAIQNGDGTWSFYSKVSGKALDIANGTTANGTNVQTYQPNYSSAQRWTMLPQKSINDGVYQILSNTNNNAALNVAGDSKESGANIHIWNNGGYDAYKVAIRHLGDGMYSIRMLNSGMYIGVTAGAVTPGNNVFQTTELTDSAKWRILPNEDGTYCFTNVGNNLHLDRAGGKNDNGTNILVWKPSTSDPQKWKLNATQPTNMAGVYQIASAVNTGFAFDINGKSTSECTVMHLWTKHRNESQMFELVPTNDGYFAIVNMNSGRCLNVCNWETANGTSIIQYHNNGTIDDNEKWTVIPNFDGTYSIISKFSGMYIDLNGAKAEDAGKIQMYTGNSSAAQKWKLEAVSGWAKKTGTYYYLVDGHKQTGWRVDGGKLYFLKSDGAMATGWNQQGSLWYYFNTDGSMKTGWLQLDGKWYYLNPDGHMATGWAKVDGKLYYMQDSGAMVTGNQTINGVNYSFNSDGSLQ